MFVIVSANDFQNVSG